MRSIAFKSLLLGTALSGVAGAAEVLVSGNITGSVTWTPNNTYNLQGQVYVSPGATLTIQAGTVVASDTNGGGSLAVTRGARIYVLGTVQNPVIFTSKADVLTWTGGNPKTGTWRESSNEWGNLTVMGSAYISENATAGNVSCPHAANFGVMEGLTAAFPGDTRVQYGGGNDNDDSGTIQYCSLRYGGKVIALNNELNGLSMGGVGRETDVHHVEIMNNIDDGIEIWGGTFNLKNFAIWNIGDDSLDIDQGYRGKIAEGLVVQGHSISTGGTTNLQGSGVGDNCLEVDGAENSDWQPVTRTTAYNLTVIGQKLDGDHGVAYRDGAGIQVRNSIFMDLGERLVAFDNVDGDGGSGYGFNGSISWANTWTTPSTTLPSGCTLPAGFYAAQTSGSINEIKDSVFQNNNFASAYTEANLRGVNAPANNNVLATALPIQSITRAAAIVRGGKVMEPVTGLDPRPANDALTSVAWAQNDGFFSSAHYRGAFAPGVDWLCGWTASSAFGFTPDDGFCDLGKSFTGTYGYPVLAGSGSLIGGQAFTLSLSNAQHSTLAILAVGLVQLNLPLFGGILCPDALITGFTLNLATDGSGNASLPTGLPAGTPPGIDIYTQSLVFDGGAPQSFAFSNTLLLTSQR